MVQFIEATPALNAEESVELLKRMQRVERRKNPTKGEQFYIDAIRENSK
ncbi:hypothetical protein HQ545_04870 [Candidatus Woesearchaeota archaeon]|nr:hypothetical protein [Candidatus Woesearchaeota archaeon]